MANKSRAEVDERLAIVLDDVVLGLLANEMLGLHVAFAAQANQFGRAML